MQKKYIPGLDLLKFMASIAIVIFHYGVIFDISAIERFPVVNYINRISGLGVELFFVISGLLIYYSESRKQETDNHKMETGGV